MSARRFWLAIAPCLALGACVLNPLTRAVEPIALSEREEVEVGRAALSQIERTKLFLAETPLNHALEELGAEVASIAPGPTFRYRFLLLDSPVPNAFALPGGIVVISRGLAALANSVDDLVGVLAHEIAHVASRHVASRLAWSAPAHALARALRGAIGIVDRSRGEMIGTYLPQLFIAPYERGQEREADMLGIALAASLGYDPMGLARMLERLEATQRGRARALESSADQSLASHPPTPARIELIEIVGAQMERGSRSDVLDILPTLDGLELGESSVRGVLAGSVLLFPALRLSLQLAPGWVHQITEEGCISVAPGGHAVLAVRSLSLAQARVARDEVLAEAGARSDGDVAVLQSGAGAATTEQRWHWLTFGETVIELATSWSLSKAGDARPVVDGVLRSLRPLDAERACGHSIERLRVIVATRSRSLDELVAEVGSTWTTAHAARANALRVDVPLAPGQRVKLAVAEPLVEGACR